MKKMCATLNCLPDELIVLVFLCLPWKPLFRLRCLSKRMRNLIDCPIFRQRYNEVHDPDFKVMLIGRDLRLFSMDFHFPNHLISSEVNEIIIPNHQFFYACIGCCQGIVCLLNSQLLDGIQMVILLNPFNGTFQIVNSNNNFGRSCHLFSAIGFGYDSATDDYKIVADLSYDQGNHISADVYSMRRDSWGKISGKFSPGSCPDTPCNIGIYVGGAIHWLWIKGDDDIFTCIAFRLETDSFISLPLPLPLRNSDHWLRLLDLGGRLCVMDHLYFSGRRGRINVWVMKEYGVATSWTPLFNIRNGKEIENIIGLFPLWDDACMLCLGSDLRSWLWFNAQDGTKEVIHVQNLPPLLKTDEHSLSWVCVMSPLRLKCSLLQNHYN